MYIFLGKACHFCYSIKKKVKGQKGQGSLMVMTPSFQPGELGLIPLVGDNSILHRYLNFYTV